MNVQNFLDHIRAAGAGSTVQPLRIEGGGSKNFYGNALRGEVLNTRGYSGIVSYEPSELVVTARCGTPLAELEAALAEKGQCLAFEPPHLAWSGNDRQATVGGMVAAGLAGPARATQGGVRDYVLGLEMIDGAAQVLRFGGTVMKNVAGYDVSRVLAGSMGTLGLITEVSLKVLPVAPAEATLKFTMDQATMLQKVNEWAGQPLPINASSWAHDADQPTLYLRLRGALAAVQAACERLLGPLGSAYRPQVVDSPEAPQPSVRADWAAARDLRLPWFSQKIQATGSPAPSALWRVSVPATAPSLPAAFGHDVYIDWLGAQRWVWLDATDTPAAQSLRDWTVAQGGHATRFYSPAAQYTAAQVPAFTPLTPTLQTINARLRAELDPLGVFDTGRI